MIVARYSPIRLLSLLAIGYALPISLVAVPLYPPSEYSWFDYWSSKGELWIPVIYLGWLCAAATAALLTVVLFNFIYHRGKSVWIAGDSVSYLGLSPVTVMRADIERVAPGSVGNTKWPAIIITLRGGEKETIGTWAFSEPQAVVLRRIEDWHRSA